MKFTSIFAAAAVIAFAGAASAQTPSTDSPTSQVTPSSTLVPNGTTTTVDTTIGSSSTQAVVTTTASATDAATGASVTASLTTNGPVPDTAENRQKYGAPMSNAGKRTSAKGN